MYTNWLKWLRTHHWPSNGPCYGGKLYKLLSRMHMWLHREENRSVFHLFLNFSSSSFFANFSLFTYEISGNMKLFIRNSFNEADERVFFLKSILFDIFLLVIEYWLSSFKKKTRIYHKKYDFSISIISVHKLGQLISYFR